MLSLRCLRAGRKGWIESWKHQIFMRDSSTPRPLGHSELNPARFLQTKPLSAGALEESSLPQKPLDRRGSEIHESTRAWSLHLTTLLGTCGDGLSWVAAGPSGSGWLENSWLKLILSLLPPILTRQFFLSVIANVVTESDTTEAAEHTPMVTVDLVKFSPGPCTRWLKGSL